MKTKSLSFRLFISILLIASITMAIFQLPACKSQEQRDKEYKEFLQQENRCPYEYGECPNQQKCVEDYTKLEEENDSMSTAIDSLNTIIASYELKEHSKIK